MTLLSFSKVNSANGGFRQRAMFCVNASSFNAKSMVFAGDGANTSGAWILARVERRVSYSRYKYPPSRKINPSHLWRLLRAGRSTPQVSNQSENFSVTRVSDITACTVALLPVSDCRPVASNLNNCYIFPKDVVQKHLCPQRQK